MLLEARSYHILEKKLNKYNTLLNEQFFKKIGQGLSAMARSLGREYVPNYTGHGGATTQDIDREFPEMKALDLGLKNVKTKENALKGMKLSNIEALDLALDQYVTALIDVYSEFKDVVNDKEKSSALPEVMIKMQKTFKDARGMLGQLTQAVSEASEKISNALKGSQLETSTLSVRRDEDDENKKPAMPAAVNAPRADMPARARGSLTRGVTGGFQPTMQESKKTKKLPSLKEVCKFD